MSIATEIARLAQAKADLKAAIEGKGVTVPASALLDDYAALVGSISGGGGAVKMGVLRPDAELVKTWTEDAYAVADYELTIPSYSTTATTLKASANIDTYTGDPLNYRYLIVERALTIPEYNITTKAKGREEYVFSAAAYEWIHNPAYQMKSLDATKEYGQYSQIIADIMNREVYWSSATAIGVYTSNVYCFNQTLTAPAIASNKTLTIKSPSIAIRGHTTYLTQTFFNAITDARIQYVIELWRQPLADIDGWHLGSQTDHILDCVNNNGGTLT